ncbi:YbaK/EbsC family protein [Candidatus Woesearchaeota archaeon]|nr:YbaK/EbsC family protein [Candidatus Woesearchaeota archaeon]
MLKPKIKVAKILDKLKIEYNLIKLKTRGRNVGCKELFKDPESTFKTIVLVDKKGKRYAFSIKLDRMIDFSKVKDIVGNKVRLAKKEELKEEGFEPGEVCPALVKLPLFVDKELMEFEWFNCGSGDLAYGLEMQVKDLKKVRDYKLVDVKRF